MSLYEQNINDAGGKSFTVRFRVSTDADAKAIADKVAEKSDGQWTELKKLTAVDISGQGNANAAAAAGSDIQRRARLSYATATAGNYIPIEIPAVKSTYVAKNPLAARTTTTNPLDATTMAKLKTENDAAATGLHLAHFITRNRRD